MRSLEMRLLFPLDQRNDFLYPLITFPSCVPRSNIGNRKIVCIPVATVNAAKIDLARRRYSIVTLCCITINGSCVSTLLANLWKALAQGLRSPIEVSTGLRTRMFGAEADVGIEFCSVTPFVFAWVENELTTAEDPCLAWIPVNYQDYPPPSHFLQPVLDIDTRLFVMYGGCLIVHLSCRAPLPSA